MISSRWAEIFADERFFEQESDSGHGSQHRHDRCRQSNCPGYLVVAQAERLPFPESRFLFFDDPLAVLRECRRVMRAGAKLAVYTNGPDLVGTPAAPDPIANQAHFYEDAIWRASLRRRVWSMPELGTTRGPSCLPLEKPDR